MDYTTENITTSDGITLSGEQVDVLKRLETESENFFVTGKAGTGKSVLLRAFVERARKARKHVVVLAPTGLAALNVGGETIHSFLHISTPIMDVRKESNFEVSEEDEEAYKHTDIIVIDEVSMVRSDCMDMLSTKLKRVRDRNEPFGGVQIVAFGDLYQLPPVIDSKPWIGTYIKENYRTRYFFGAPVVRAHPFVKIELTQVRRQNDELFVKMLNNAREGEDRYKTAEYFDKQYTESSLETYNNVLMLTTTRNYANQVNKQHFDELEGEAKTYTATIEGRVNQDDIADSNVDIQLELKVGAKVMMIRNDGERRWVNGTIAHITSLSTDSIGIKIGQNEYEVTRCVWNQYHVYYNKETGELSQRRVGTITQFPIRLAYALTIHKAQGQTLDSIVIDYGGTAPFESGQAYVALSRCKTYEGIVTKSHITPNNFKINKTVKAYLERT